MKKIILIGISLLILLSMTACGSEESSTPEPVDVPTAQEDPSNAEPELTEKEKEMQAAEEAFNKMLEQTYLRAITSLENKDYKNAYLGFYSLEGYKDSDDYIAKLLSEDPSYAYVGDEIYFGTYEQDGNLENGPEPIKWTVENIYDGDILLRSYTILEVMPYNAAGGECGWQNCSLRKWLNSDFYNTAFSAEEKAIMVEHFVRDSQYNDLYDMVTVPPASRTRSFPQGSAYAISKGLGTAKRDPSDTFDFPIYWVQFARNDSTKTYAVSRGYKNDYIWMDHTYEYGGVLPEIMIHVEETTMAAHRVRPSKSSGSSADKCTWCNGTGAMKYNYGSSDLEAVLSGHDPYTYGICGSCGGTGKSK